MAGELFSGTFHWATDNYGRLETPVVGFACAAFQGHHLAPWTISHRSFPNNVYKIAAATLPLFLLGLPPLLRRITALRARLRPRSLALVLSLGMVLVSLDNIAWLGHQAEQPPPRLVRLTPAMETVIARLSELHEDRGGPDVVLSTSHTLLNFVPVLSPLKAFYGHVQCTPDFGARVQQARAFLRDGAELDPTVQWFVVEAPLLDRLPRLRAAFEPVETLAGYTILRRRRAPAGARER